MGEIKMIEILTKDDVEELNGEKMINTTFLVNYLMGCSITL